MGRLADMQRDTAWQGKSSAERAAGSALAGYGPDEPSPDVIAFRERLKRDREMDTNFGRAGLSEEVGRIADSGGVARAEFGPDAQKKKEAAKKGNHDIQIMLATIEGAQAYSAALGREIDQMETGFEAQYGDAWREIMANRVMDPDDIPQQRDGESIEDYRERLEEELIEAMIDPATGEIRPEYRDDPEMAQWAQWAKAQWDKRTVDAAVEQVNDPDATPDQRAAGLDTLNSYEEIRQFRQESDHLSAEAEAQTDARLEKESDNLRDETIDYASEAGGFSLGPT